jgi:hypothetical protein
MVDNNPELRQTLFGKELYTPEAKAPAGIQNVPELGLGSACVVFDYVDLGKQQPGVELAGNHAGSLESRHGVAGGSPSRSSVPARQRDPGASDIGRLASDGSRRRFEGRQHARCLVDPANRQECLDRRDSAVIVLGDP